MIAQLGRQLALDEELGGFWDAANRVGPCQRIVHAIGQVVLPSAARRLPCGVSENAARLAGSVGELRSR